VDNARLYEEAQRAVRARDAFLARASHELRTPLTSALGTVRMMERGGFALQAPLAELVRVMSRNLRGMTELINDLLDASKLAHGGEPVAPRRVQAAAVVRAACDLVAGHARERGVALRSDVPGELQLTADPLRLEQLFVNLIGNAIKFTSAGGEVRVEAEAAAEAVTFRVRDTGEGIAPEHLERIFEPFVQAGGTGGRRERGTGLGLTICRQIAALHGGRIHAESEGPGRGSTFVVEIPASGPAVDGSAPAPPHQA
jgi:signal transduction histidine kinase